MAKDRRATEKDYLRALSDVCPIETWGQIVTKAVEQAQGGDPQARAWLAKYLCANATLASSLSRIERLTEGFE